jgi:parallel beta-helix repeat protein
MKCFFVLLFIVCTFLFLGNPLQADFTNGQNASLVIGQANFTTTVATITKFGLGWAADVAFDSSDNLWVTDIGGRRILMFSFPFTNGMNASLVIGQLDFTTSIATTTQSGVRGAAGLAFDSFGNLWVVDYQVYDQNNRVLRFSPPFTNGMNASLVIGQPDFTTRDYATTQSGLRAPLDVAFDSFGNLWVADLANNRVLKFTPPFTNGMNASLVLGQPDFTTDTSATTQSGMYLIGGGAITFDSSGNLWVGDGWNNRLLKFTPPFTNGMDASLVLGQPDFTTKIATTSQSGFARPTELTFDSSGNLWVSDYDNNRVLRFTPPFTNGMNASLVLGQSDFTTRIATTTQSGMNLPGGLSFDTSGNFWVADSGNARVLRFSPTIITGTISGKVTKSDGSTAIQGALVELLRDSVIVSSMTTDTSGNYSMTIATGTYDVFVSSVGYYSKLSTGVVVESGSLITNNYSLTTAPTGLVGYWKFDEGKGIVAFDYSGQGNKGTIYGSSWTAGQVNGALNFDGVDDYVELSSIGGNMNFSYSGWFKLDTVTPHSQQIVQTNDIILCMHSDNLTPEVWEDRNGYEQSQYSYSYSLANFLTGVWYNVVVTAEGNENINLYLNGQWIDKLTWQYRGRTSSYAYSIIGVAKMWFEGLVSQSYYFNGIIDEVRIYNRALTQAEIQAEAGIQTGTIAGKVTKSDGVTAISGATVEALLGYSVIASTTTATDGTYQLTNLSTGTYSVRASASGYVTKVVSGYVVSAGQTTTVDLTLSAIGAEIYLFESKWGTGYPSGVTIDASGNVYVAEYPNHQIQKFTSDGTFLTKWGSYGLGDGQFYYPWDVAVDSLGNVYVADRDNYRIQKFTSEGTFLTKWGSSGSGDGQFSSPEGVAVDGSGNVYVADTYNNRIQKFSSTGTFITKWGSYGSGNGQLYSPWGISVDAGGNVYVADSYNHRVQKFTSTGTFITKWGSYGSGNGNFNYPYGIAVDVDGSVYIADTYNHRIQKFTSGGTFLTKWGGSGSGDGQFSSPFGIAVDAGGNVYVADYSNHRIQKFKSYPAGWIIGKVSKAADGTGISGALVETLAGYRVIVSTTTNTSGDYTMFVPTGTYKVRATISGYGISGSTITVIENSTTTANLSLVAAGQVQGIYSENITWTLAGSPYLIKGAVVFDTGATLTIEPGVVVKFSTGTFLRIKGALKAQGSADKHIIFTSDKTSPAKGDWQYIEFSAGCDTANSIVSYCEIKYAQYGLYLNYASPKEISNNIISDSGGGYSYAYGIYLNNSGAGTTISNNIIKNNNSYGIYANNGTGGMISGNKIENNGSYGIYFSYGTGGTISGNTVRYNSDGGIYIYSPNGEVTVSNNTVEGNNGYGIYFYSSGYLGGTISGNTIQNNTSYGIYLYGWTSTPLLISNNTVTRNANYGIYQSYSGNTKIYSNTISSHTTAGLYLQNAEVNRNQITGNGYGIQINGNYVTITKNTITGNTRGIQSDYIPQLGNKNNFYGNTEYDFYNNTTSDISLPYNWWGTTVTTNINTKIYDYYDPNYDKGKVIYAPVETSEVQWWINNAPTLSWTGETNYTADGLHPETGDSETDFVYRVKYTDLDGDEPQSGYPKVHILKDASEISGSPFTMGLAGSTSDYTSGVIYSYTTSLTASTTYTYFFEAYDVWGSSASGSPTSAKDAPDVTQAPPGTIVTGLISTDTTWTVSGSPYKVIGNLVIESGKILTIQPGVNVQVSTDAYIRIDGGIQAVGISDKPIIFTSAKKTKSAGSWQYIKFTEGSDTNSTISYCEIKYAQYGIYLDYRASPKEISNNLISNNSNYGIYCYYTSSATTISENIIEQNDNYGINAQNSAAKIDSNVIRNNFGGIYVYGYYSWYGEEILIISNNTISNNNRSGWWSSGDGLNVDSVFNAKINIFNNTISSNTRIGLHTAGIEEVSRNRIYANGVGIQSANSNISSNTVTGNGIGIQTSMNPRITKNNLYGNTTDFYRDANSDISLPYNWWGTTETAKIDKKIYDFYDDFNKGKITYTPIERQEIEWWKDLTAPTGKPSTPTDEGIYTSTTTITFYWGRGTADDPESGIVGYWLEIKEVGDSGYVVKFSSDVGTATSYNITDCLHGKTYSARVKAKNGYTESPLYSEYSDWSDGITVDTTSPTGMPSPPTDRGDWGGATLTFKWIQDTANDPESGIAGYWLQVAVSSWLVVNSSQFENLQKHLDTDVGNVLSYDVPGCENGKMYFARVKARNGAGVYTDWSGISDGITVDTQPPTIPEITDIKQNGATVNQIKGGEISLEATTEVGVTTTCMVTIKDQLGNILTQGISFNVTVDTATGKISGKIDLGDLVKSYPVSSQIIIEVTVEDLAGNRSTGVISSPIYVAPTGTKFILYNNLFDPTKNEEVIIKYELVSNEDVSIKIYDFGGNLVKNIIDNEYRSAGIHTETWDGKNEDDVIVASGIYLVQINTGSFKETKKAAVVE